MRILFLTIICSLFWPGVTDSYILYAQPTRLSQNKNGNLELHVVTDENVSIKVFIDGKPAVEAQFHKEPNAISISIAPHKIFFFNLQQGKHTLRAEADSGKQSFSGEFEIREKGVVIKQNFNMFNVGAEALFNDLIKNGYIDVNGIIQGKFSQITDSSQMKLNQVYRDWEKQEIYSILQQSDKRWLSLNYVDPQRIKQKEQFTLEVYDWKIMYE